MWQFICFSLVLLAPLNAGFPAGKSETKAEEKIFSDSVFEHWAPRHGHAPTWSYHDPGAWPTLIPNCAGQSQSPIAIHKSTSVLTSYPKFEFHNYGSIDHMQLTNNGHTALYSLPHHFDSSSVPSITGGGLDDQFNFLQFHLHWGSDSSKGAEHVVRSKTYAAELHLVHYNTKYGSFHKAVQHSDGLAVLGISIEVSKNDNEALQPVIDQLSQINGEYGKETTLNQPISFTDVIPKDTSSFYRYSGSLTNPNCNQVVIWTVFKNPISLSESQLSQFRKLESADGGPLVNNFRPPQPLNDRVVTRT